MTGLRTSLRPDRSRVLLLILVLGLWACASPPRGADQSGGTQERSPENAPAAEPDPESSSGAYDFESEGEFPEPATDVEFEEDRLPPPENVGGEPIDRGGVDAEELDAVEAPFEEPAADLPVEAETEAPVEPQVTTPLPSTDPERGARGFRVQLAATTERVDADRVAREARNRLRTEVYIVLEGSLYKVRAGDFSDRGDALLLRDRARANGYPEAWMVATEIEP